MRRLVAGVAAIVVASLGITQPVLGSTPAATGAVATAPSTLHWGGCPTRLYPDIGGGIEQCAKLVVPLDYSHPNNGKTVTLEVSILRHTSSAKNYRGVALANPGGPGDGGLDVPIEIGPYIPHGVGNDFDWVSWDPRGVGASKPAMHCERNYFHGHRASYLPTTKRLLRYWLKRSKRYADTCARKYPNLINHITSLDSAKDMESIRKALGVDKIDFYGFSYGTYLGEIYSTLYPQHVRRMVLDSNIDPRSVWYQANLDQDRAFDRNIRLYFKWIAKYHAVYHLGLTKKAVYHRYYRDLAKLTRHPDGALGPDEFQDAMEGAAYYRLDFKELAYAWSRYSNHHSAGAMISEFRATDTPGDDNGFAVYNAVQCSDVQWPTKWSRWKRDNNRYYKKYPFMTWSNAWYNAPCLYWKGQVHKPVKINGTKTKSVLLIDETLDAATPFKGSLEVRRLYPNSSLIAEPGGATHADSLYGDSCVDDQIAAYLKNGTRPHRKHSNGPDLLCKPLPDPTASKANPAFRQAQFRTA